MKNKIDIFIWNFPSYIGRPRPVLFKKWLIFWRIKGIKNFKILEIKFLKNINKSRIKLLKKIRKIKNIKLLKKWKIKIELTAKRKIWKNRK